MAATSLRTLRVDPQAKALPRRLRPGAEFGKLGRGVEDNMPRVLQQLLEILLPIGPTEDVNLFLRELLIAQPGLVKPAGLGAR